MKKENREKLPYPIAINSFRRYKNGEKRLDKHGGTIEYDETYFDSLIESFLSVEDYERCSEVNIEKSRLKNNKNE